MRTAAGVILTTKLKNAVMKRMDNGNLEFVMKNICINGDNRGTSGFIRNKDNGVIIYACTERSVYGGMMYYRYAKNLKDYHGGFNHNVYSLDEMADGIAKDLLNENLYNDCMTGRWGRI